MARNSEISSSGGRGLEKVVLLPLDEFFHHPYITILLARTVEVDDLLRLFLGDPIGSHRDWMTAN